MASRNKVEAQYVVIHRLDAGEASEANAETRARARAKGVKLPATAASARTLREWRELLAARDGKLEDPVSGQMRTIPLASFADADPDRTWLQIGFGSGHLPYASYTVEGGAMIVRGRTLRAGVAA